MLASAPLGMLKRWEYFDELEPFGNDQRFFALAASEICNLLLEIKAHFKEQKLRESDFYKASKFLPRRKKVVGEVQTKQPKLVVQDPKLMQSLGRSFCRV